MRLQFLGLPQEERRLYFEQAAQRRGLLPVIVEKDFWVCWLGSIRPGTAGDFQARTAASSIARLRRDYAAMRDMYLTDPIHVDRILDTLADLQARINESH